MRVRALFIGLAKARASSIVSSIEKVSEVTLVSSPARGSDGKLTELISKSDAVFINRDQKELIGIIWDSND